METLWTVGLLVFALCLNPLHAHYTVNSVPLAGCDSSIDLEGTEIPVEVGDSSFPCVGYVRLDLGTGTADRRRVCAGGGMLTFFSNAAASRVCHTKGINKWRGPNGEDIMLYECQAYTGAGVESPDIDNFGTTPVAAVIAGTYGAAYDPRCHPSLASPDSSCFDDCYIGAIEDLSGGGVTGAPTNMPPIAIVEDIIPAEVTVTHRADTEANCLRAGGPFWAITCQDFDECHTGVRTNCSNSFASSCTLSPACGPGTKCTNLPGSYRCECRTGYQPAHHEELDPYYEGCEDVDECHENEHICGPDAQCRNTEGSYICICADPHYYNYTTNTCIGIPCPSLPAVPHAYPQGVIPAHLMPGDKVIYACAPGYRVDSPVTPSTVLASYGSYSPERHFEVTCYSGGMWKPHPLPNCIPIHCGEPPMVANADRSRALVTFNSTVTYSCRSGFQLHDQTLGTTSFTISCTGDSSWTRTTTCQNVDECSEDHDLCGVGKFCIDTPGSYLCSCVPWYQKDLHDSRCVEWAGLVDFPQLKPCEIILALGFCTNGECEMEDGVARCKCDPGYAGVACDQPRFGSGFIIAIVALIISGLLLLCFFIMYCCRLVTAAHQGRKCLPPPVYGCPPPRMMLPPPGRRFDANRFKTDFRRESCQVSPIY